MSGFIDFPVQLRWSLHFFSSFHLLIQLLFDLSDSMRFLMLFALGHNDPSNYVLIISA